MSTNLIEAPVTATTHTGTTHTATTHPGTTHTVTTQESPESASADRHLAEPSTADRGRFPELPNELEKELVQVFKLLSDETRLRILVYLTREAELHVTALCDRLGQSQPAVSHHLALLRVAGLIKARRDGKHNFYSVRQSRFRRLMEQLLQSIGDNGKGQIRFDEFIVTHEH